MRQETACNGFDSCWRLTGKGWKPKTLQTWRHRVPWVAPVLTRAQRGMKGWAQARPHALARASSLAILFRPMDGMSRVPTVQALFRAEAFGK